MRPLTLCVLLLAMADSLIAGYWGANRPIAMLPLLACAICNELAALRSRIATTEAAK